MTLDGSNQYTDATPTLQMDLATFQAAATITMTAAMTQLNATNTNGNKNGAKNSNRGDNQGHQRVCSYKDSPNHEPKVSHEKKEYYLRKESSEPRERVVQLKDLPKDNKQWQPIPLPSLLPHCRQGLMLEIFQNATSSTCITVESFG